MTPFISCTRASTALAMSVALVPLRLATVMVTAGYSCSRRCTGMRFGGAEENIVLRIGGTIDDAIGNVAKIDGLSVGDAEHDAFKILRVAEEVAGIDANLLIALGEFPCLGAGVGGLQPSDDILRREAERRQLRAVQNDPHGARAGRR